jgi:hypothetical protein
VKETKVQLIVGTTAVKIPSGGRARPIIQNLGPGNIFFDTEGSVTPEGGLKLVPEAIYEFPTMGTLDDIWIVASEANTEVRVVAVG